MKIYVGTSGWAFPNWVGILYPDDLPQKKWLNFYSQVFNCVEVNSTFYRLFKTSTYSNWLKSVGDNFRFIIKIPQEISHKKRLMNIFPELDDFCSNIEILGTKIGLLLLQLPPSFDININIFADVVKYIRTKFPLAVEFRNALLRSDEILQVLIENDCTFVNPDSPGYRLKNIISNKTLYYRLHGRYELHKSPYDEDELKEIAISIQEFSERISEAYIIFNNGVFGYSIPNAIKLQELLGMNINRAIILPKYYQELGL